MTRQKSHEKSNLIKTSLFILVFVLLTGFFSVYAVAEYEHKQYAENVLRLHVIANSNTSEDQALKLKVRDTVGITVSTLTEGADNAEQTEEIVKNHIDDIKKAAEDRISDEGYNYTVEIKTGEFYFPTKYYANGALPAGNYEAVRVIIGEGKGENWWCVLFPPLCFSNGKADANINKTEPSENESVTVKFKIVEIFQEAKHSISSAIEKFFK